MSRRIDLTQWRDRTEEPVIIWVPVSDYTADPYAVDDTHDNDLYQEYASAFYAARAYYTAAEMEDRASWYDLTPAQMWELYEAGDGSADRAGLPVEWYAEGTEPDGSDSIIYVDPETFANSSRETLEEAVKNLEAEDVAAIYREIIEARKEYDY